jgi:hypothetical protein
LNFDWNLDKNELLKETRKISFEMVLEEISEGRILEDTPHPNNEKYPNQFIFVVKIMGYCYLVPYVQNNNTIFLKTIIPSRKMMTRIKIQYSETLNVES